MPKVLFSFIITCFLYSGVSAQAVWTDTLRTKVDLKNFSTGKAIVEAQYGKVIMYFNQKDYYGHEKNTDTVKLTPKYFNNNAITLLLKEGKVKIFRRSSSAFVSTYTHYLKQYASMCSRIYEFEDGVSFYSHVEITGIMGAVNLNHYAKKGPKEKKVPKKEFEYPETFANLKDKNKIRIKDYFPEKSKSHYVYTNNNGYGESDTIECRSALLKNINVFYFAECYSKTQLISIGTSVFGPGIYFYKNDSLFAIEADFENEIAEKDPKSAALLLPAVMAPGYSVTFDFGLEKHIFTYLSNEDLTIENTIYKDCVKIKIIEQWPGTIYLGYVWLQKGKGMVKWMRSTGRIDSFVSEY